MYTGVVYVKMTAMCGILFVEMIFVDVRGCCLCTGTLFLGMSLVCGLMSVWE